MTTMLPRVQNAIGELCLEIGMTQEGFQYFQKAWFNLMEFSSRNLKDNQDLVKQKGRVGAWRGHHFLWFRVRLLGSYQPWRQGTGHVSFVCLIFLVGMWGLTLSTPPLTDHPFSMWEAVVTHLVLLWAVRGPLAVKPAFLASNPASPLLSFALIYLSIIFIFRLIAFIYWLSLFLFFDSQTWRK